MSAVKGDPHIEIGFVSVVVFMAVGAAILAVVLLMS